jgi:hypothetical protein
VKSSKTTTLRENPVPSVERRPGRFKGILTVGSEFFEPLSENELADFDGS